MSDRVLNRRGARELTPEEMDWVTGSGECFITACGAHFTADDERCIP